MRRGGVKSHWWALVPAKSFVYPIDFKFNNSGKPTYKYVTEICADFEAPNTKGAMVKLGQLETHEAQETLGVYVAPDDNNEETTEQIRKKANEWSNLVLTGHLIAQDIRRALDTNIIKSLEYPLPALTLTEKECKKLWHQY